MPALSPTRIISLSAFACLLLLPGCRVKPTSANSNETIPRIAERLIEAAEMRVDLRQVHACLHEIHEIMPGGRTAGLVEAGLTRATLARELEHQFVLALHSRMNLVEADLMAPPGEGEGEGEAAGMGAQVASMAKYFGASHLLVGDYSIRDTDLLISIRLVDAESLIIVAAAGGSVPVSSLSDQVRRMVRRDSISQGAVRRVRR